MNKHTLSLGLELSSNSNDALTHILNIKEFVNNYTTESKLQGIFNRPLFELYGYEDIITSLNGLYPMTKVSIPYFDMPLIFGIALLNDGDRKIFVSPTVSHLDFNPVNFPVLLHLITCFLEKINFGDLVDLSNYLNHLTKTDLIDKDRSETLFQELSDYFTFTDDELINTTSQFSEVI